MEPVQNRFENSQTGLVLFGPIANADSIKVANDAFSAIAIVSTESIVSLARTRTSTLASKLSVISTSV